MTLNSAIQRQCVNMDALKAGMDSIDEVARWPGLERLNTN